MSARRRGGVPAGGRDRGPRPRFKKRLGQHHLTDPRLCRPVLEFLEPGRQDEQDAAPGVVEIGPGGGILTEGLAAAGLRVVALELDPEWAFHLRRRMLTGVSLAVADALEVDWRALQPGWAVVGNLPYQVATAVIERLLDDAPVGTRAAFLVQREVAQRLLAGVGDAAYGSLSVLVRARARGRSLGRVRAGSFHPPPKVESAFVGLCFGPHPLAASEWPALKKTVRLAFSRRRGTLRNALASGLGRARAERVLERAGLAMGTRAEELDLEPFLVLHRLLQEPGSELP